MWFFFNLITFYKVCTLLLFINMFYYFYNNINELNDILFNSLFQLMHLYSRVIIVYNKNIKPILFSFFTFFNNIINKPKFESKIEFFNKSILINKDYINNIFINDNFYLLKNELEPQDYDLIIFTDMNTLQHINKICFRKFPSSLLYEQSNIKFLSINLLYQNQSIEIILQNNLYNFYIVNNIIDKKFLFYFMKNIINYKLNCNENDFIYKLTIIDQNVNIKNLDQNCNIVFEKNNYEIYDFSLNKKKNYTEHFILT